MKFFNDGSIKPIIYKENVGLESIPCAMEDLKARKTCGRTIVIIDTQGDVEGRAEL